MEPKLVKKAFKVYVNGSGEPETHEVECEADAWDAGRGVLAMALRMKHGNGMLVRRPDGDEDYRTGQPLPEPPKGD